MCLMLYLPRVHSLASERHRPNGVTGSGELKDIAAADVDAARRAIAQHRDWIAGSPNRIATSAEESSVIRPLGRSRGCPLLRRA
jgi:predicted amidohydrolase